MVEKISKSERKRRFKREEEAATELALLSDKDLKNLPADKNVKDEILKCRSVKGGARKRQIKYLAKVMRQGDVDEVLNFLADKKGSKLKENRIHHEAERLRDTVINEAIEYHQYCRVNDLDWEPDWPGEEINSLIEDYRINEGDLRRTIHQYVRTRVHNHYREVFRMIKAAIEQKELLGGPD